MKFLLGLSSSNLPGGNSRPGNKAPGQNRLKRKITNTLNQITSRTKSTIRKINIAGSKKRNTGRSIARKKIRTR